MGGPCPDAWHSLGRACLSTGQTTHAHCPPTPVARRICLDAGPRRPLDREQRSRFSYLLRAHRRAGRLSPLAEIVGTALLKRLAVDGRCDPGHDRLADDVGCSSRTVRRALDALRRLGLVLWQRRLVREQWRARQTTNAYVLCPAEVPNPPATRPRACGGQTDRETLSVDNNPVEQRSSRAVAEAQAALAQRRREVEANLLTRGSRFGRLGA